MPFNLTIKATEGHHTHSNRYEELHNENAISRIEKGGNRNYKLDVKVQSINP